MFQLMDHLKQSRAALDNHANVKTFPKQKGIFS